MNVIPGDGYDSSESLLSEIEKLEILLKGLKDSEVIDQELIDEILSNSLNISWILTLDDSRDNNSITIKKSKIKPKPRDKYNPREQQLELDLENKLFFEQMKKVFNELLYLNDNEFNSYTNQDIIIINGFKWRLTKDSEQKILRIYRKKIKKVISLIEHFYWVDSEIKRVLHELWKCSYFDTDILKSHLSKPWLKKLKSILES